MNALLKAELLRLVSRRLFVMLLVGMAALAAVGAATAAPAIQPPSAQEIAEAEQSLEWETEAWEQDCGAEAVGPECEGWAKPTMTTFDWRDVGFGDYVEGVLQSGFPLLLLAVAALVASLVGAEFASGNIGTQLVFTPQRRSVMTAKLAVGGVAGTLLAAAFIGASLVLSAITFLALRGAHDLSAGIELPLLIGRIMVLALLLALMSGALTMGLGSSLVTMGVFTVVYVGSLMVASAIRGNSWLHPFMPSGIFEAMMSGSHEVYDWVAIDAEAFANSPALPAQIIHYDWALGYSVIGTVIIVAAAAWWFQRRDILR